MKKFIIPISFSVLLFACGEPSTEEIQSDQALNTIETSEQVTVEEMIDNEAIEIDSESGFTTDVELIFESITSDKTEEKSTTSMSSKYVDCGAKSAYYILTGDGITTLYFKFLESNWSGIINTCGWDEPANASFTAPFPSFNKYQMMLMSEYNGGFTFYNNCEQDVEYKIQTEPGRKYYVYVNDQSGMHEDNDGQIRFWYGYE